MLRIERLSITVPRPDGTSKALLTDLTFEIPAGGSIGLVGEAGSGKSLLVAAIAGLIRAPLRAQGKIIFGGADLLAMDADERRKILGRQLGILLPGGRARLNPLARVGKQIAQVIIDHQKDVSRRDAEAKAVELLGRVGIPDPGRRAKSYPHELSGGMAQRALIAMVLANHPQFIVADEPTTGLDVTVQRQVLEDFASLTRQEGLGIMIASRDMGIIAHYCERVFVLGNGRLTEGRAIEDFFSNPSDRYSRELIEATRLERSRKELA
jgi:ABC-type glutathione transport system ATPase component